MVSTYLNILFSKPCSRDSWPQVIKSFIFFRLETERQEHFILSATGNADNPPPYTHIFTLCVTVSGFVCFEAACDQQNDALLS